MDQHHEVKTVTQEHVHDSGETHEHINKSIGSCEDSECESTCKNIETVKLSSHQPNKLFGEIEQYLEVHLPIEKNIYHNISNKDFSYYLIATGPPIPIEELMPRIGVTVRII